jgi:long-chain acyl-CoA synthetase
MESTRLSGPPLAPYGERTLVALFHSAVERFREQPALGVAGDPARLSYGEVEARVAGLAAALASHGVRAGDRVALLSENRPEWPLVDYAALSLGAVTVPIYPTLPAGQVAGILADAEPSVVFVSGASQAEKVTVADAVPLVAFDGAAGARATSLAAFMERASGSPTRQRDRAEAVAPDDLATLIYTSGTTGAPKGVMLTHANLAAMVAATRQHGSLAVSPGEVALSILPLSHVFERAAAYYFFLHGVATVYAESMQTVPRDLAAVRPHHVIAVPRLFEKVFDAATGAPGVKGRIARWAAGVAAEQVDAVSRGGRPSASLRIRRALADRLVYRVLRERMGGRLRTFICGGAPLDPRVGALFHAAGLPVYEGYGLTETSPVIAANRPGALRLGSAGVPYPGVEVRLGEADEIQVRGPSVARGYWRRPDETAAAFTPDGWLRTGDVGVIADGFLHVVDRLKDLIVTAGGKNVAPQPLEQRVTASPLVAQAVLIGDRRPYLVLLVVPARAGGAGEPPSEAAIAAEIASRLHDAGRVERPKRVLVIPEELTVENGRLTPTLKVRRRAVEAAYASRIDDVYARRAGAEIPWGDVGV